MSAVPNKNVSHGMECLERHCREDRRDLLRMASYWLHDAALAEDALQDATLRAIDGIHKGLYDVSRPFAPWFWQVLRRQIYNKLNRQVKPDGERLLSLSQFTSEQAEVCGNLISYDNLDGIIAQIDGSPEQDALRATWHNLTEAEQALLHAAYVEERPFNELAIEQGCTPAALRNRLKRTRDKMRVYVLVQLVSER